jgi:outer membrane receptor for ferric coprogen and ferric-rhodotorulic acid
MIRFKNTLSLAIQAAMLGTLTVGTSTVVLADTSVNQHTISTQVNIAAGSLDQVLAQFSGLSGVQISYDPILVAGKKSAGLKGQYGFEQGIAELLKGTGLKLAKRADGAWTIEPNKNQARDMGQLKPIDVNVQGSANRDANAVQLPVINVTAENENSYTVKNTSTATRLNLSIKDTPQSVSVITRQRMDDQNLTNIPKVLEQTPGILLFRDAGERFAVYSRGSEIDKYQFDGITTHVESQTQNITQQLADTAIYDKVEVVRGATGLLTGAGNPGGMLNMVRKKPTREFQASVEGSVARWNDYRGQVDVSGPLIESGKLRGRFVAAKQDNDTFTDHYSQKRDILYGVAEADLTDSTTVRLGIDYQKYEVNGGTGVPLFYTDGEPTNFSRSTTVTSKQRNEGLETTNYFVNIDQSLANDWKLSVAGNYMDTNRDISNGYKMDTYSSSTVDKATGEFPVNRQNKTNAPLNQKSVTINLQGPFSLFGREHQAIVGYEFSRYKSLWESYGYSNTIADFTSIHTISPTSNNDLYAIQDFYIIQRGYYGALRLNPADKLHVILGARVSDYKYETAFSMPVYDYYESSGYKKKGEVTPYAGLVYDLTSEQSVYASYTDIFKPNNVNDINGKVIDPQIGTNYEVGWKGEFYDGGLNANLALYQVKRDNVTELDGYNSGMAYYRATNGVKTKGIDIEIAGEVLPGWNVSGSYSHSKSKNADGSRYLTSSPVNTVILYNTYQFSGELQGLTIGGGARWLSETSVTYNNFNSKVVQDAYVVADLMARYRLNKNLTATLNISNLFDKKYYSGLGGVGYGFYGSPRNVTLGLRYQF